MKLNLDTPSDEGRIELLPLIDVVFCILTFFILAALQLTRQQAITVDLPKASTGETQMQKMLIVGIDAQGRTYVDQQVLSASQLERQLKRFKRWNPSGLMVLYAPKDARYNDVVGVLDQMRAVGGSRVALATLPSSAETPEINPQNPATPGTNPEPSILLPAPGDAPPAPNPFAPTPSAPSSSDSPQ
ncbi:MAG: biopolymer transporter ExbD [Microcoleaceae cyanobacterium]